MRSVGRFLLTGAAFGVFMGGTVALVEWRAPDPLGILWLGLSFAFLFGVFELVDRRVERLVLVFLLYAIALASVLAVGAVIRGDDFGLVDHIAVPLGVAAALTALAALVKPWERWAERKRNELRPEPGSE